MHASALPLLRRQPFEKRERLLASAAEGRKRQPAIATLILTLLGPTIRIERQRVAVDDAPGGPIGGISPRTRNVGSSSASIVRKRSVKSSSMSRR